MRHVPAEISQVTPRKSGGLSVGEIIALCALIIGILLVITPVNALSRSAFLLIVLGAASEDIVTRSIMLEADFYHVKVRLIRESAGAVHKEFDFALEITREPQFAVKLRQISG